ncbi:tetratricopeptide repeat protein [Lutibacter sp. A80]|uniref:tetratricopeptide repeat protein n=1 Tax=Lutibacter sp. A80 TaxID=2918453 RepID=UPI001F06372C|nr:tetratricopeptide repeat protein [Lutibacter sp. A80]UMB59277.1 tetratricopeptide repeat protein [Lutibacter sp. A80]
MDELKYIEFENYLKNKLSQTEKVAFEAKLQSNADLKQEFKIYKALETSLSSKFENEKGEQELRNTLTNLGNQFIKTEKAKKESKVISLFNYKKLLVAASIALLIGFFIFKNGNPAYSDFANHSNLEFTVRGDNNTTIKTAETAFNTKNYTTAFAQLTVLEKEFPNNVEIQLYKAICLLELDKFSQAETIFEKISTGNSAYSTKATWYKALSLLKQEKFEACKSTLKTIPESAEEYEIAKKLLNKL